MRAGSRVVACAGVAAIIVGAAAGSRAQGAGYVWRLPPGFVEPRVPADNPMTVAKVALGRHLFYERRLSSDGTFACATCHQQARAFADDKGRGVGVNGDVHPRGSMSLANVAYASVLTWANPTVRSLEAQALMPMFSVDPVELGLEGRETTVLQSLAADPRYRRLFADAFPDEPDPFTIDNITRAIASFERTLLSGRSPYDRYRTTMDTNAISAAAHRGEDLFFSERLSCFRCHSGFNFTLAVTTARQPLSAPEFHNTGLYNLGGRGGYPPANTGIFAVTRRPEDMGRHKAPTLRNIALTAPYMHDGSLPTLEAVIAHYEAGGRTIASGPDAGRGSASPLKSPFIKGFTLTAGERQDLIAFLESLTDVAFVTDPELADPWRAGRTAGRTSASAAAVAPTRAAAGSAGAALAPAPAPSRLQPSADAAASGVGGRQLDFDAAFRALHLNPAALDADRGSGAAAGNGIPDADELAVIAALVADRPLPEPAPGGVDRVRLREQFLHARTLAVDDLRILSSAYPGAADLVAGYALLGPGALNGFKATPSPIRERVTGDYSAASAYGRWLAADGDADGDGASNRAEFVATRGKGRAAYVAAALDPAITPAGLGKR